MVRWGRHGLKDRTEVVMFNIHPDELVYSACARFSDRVQYCSYQDVADDLFGDPSVLIKIDFPSNLAALASRLPVRYGYSADQLIDNHTVVPFYAPFLRPDRLTQIRSALTTPQKIRSRQSPYLFSQQVCPSQVLRYCSVCLEEDRRQYGEGYWHRGHQLPGINLCPDHESWLRRSEIPIQVIFARKRLVTIEQALDSPTEENPTFPHEYRLLGLAIARDATWLVRHPNQHSNSEIGRQRYIRLLAERGWATFNGRIRERSLLKAFYHHFPATILQYYEFPITLAQQANPLLRLLRAHGRSQHPLHHLLLLQFLGTPIEVFWELPSEPAPFGSGPWPCLNPKAFHFREHVVSCCRITPDPRKGHPIGTFECDCGFAYQRDGPDPGPIARFTMDRVLAPNHQDPSQLMKSTLNPLQSGVGLERDLSTEIDAVNPDRCRMRPSHTPLATSMRHHGLASPLRKDMELLNKRHCWLEVLEESRDLCKPAAKAQAPRLYRWLYEHDRAWLLEHRPPYRARRIGRRSYRSEDEDAAAVRAVHTAMHALRSMPGKPIWHSRTVILREVRLRATFPDDLRRVPQAAALLTSMTESREQFITRRLKWAMDLFRLEGCIPTRRQLILRTGLRILHHSAVDLALQRIGIKVVEVYP